MIVDIAARVLLGGIVISIVAAIAVGTAVIAAPFELPRLFHFLNRRSRLRP